MTFIPNVHVRRAISGTLTVAVVALMGWVGHIAPTPAPMAATQDAFAIPAPFHLRNAVLVTPAADPALVPGLQTDMPGYHFQPVRHWLKRNAPIVGGAAGGALIGGLAGGGTGALIGGAAGAGGGALYKHYRHRHYHRY